jgi:putative oxidoreductase
MDLGLLILRIVVGGLFVGHGLQKLFGWFGGHGLQGTGQFFESIGYRPGRFMALVGGLTEAVGGLLLLSGLLTPLGAAMVIAMMINAIVTVKRSAGLWNGYELDLLYAVAAVGLAFTGAGAYSVDALAGWDLSGTAWGLGALALGVVMAEVGLVWRRATRRPAIPEVEQLQRQAA